MIWYKLLQLLRHDVSKFHNICHKPFIQKRSVYLIFVLNSMSASHACIILRINMWFVFPYLIYRNTKHSHWPGDLYYHHPSTNTLVIIQYEHERKDARRHHPDAGRTDQPYMDSSVSSLRIENMELRRKIDDLETQATEMQQKHLKEASNLCIRFHLYTDFY